MPESVDLDVLAIAAHPDDVEITCGGLLIKMAEMGRRVGVLDLTKGEMGTWGDENDRETEAAEAARVMGLTTRVNLGLPDSAVTVDQESKLKVAQVIRNTQPELVILPHWQQRHPDHQACQELGYDACFLAGLQKIDLDGEPFRPRKIIYASYFRNTAYSFLVDISSVLRKKMAAVACYKSQFGDLDSPLDVEDPGDDIMDFINSGGRDIFTPGINIYDLIYTRARNLGQLVGVPFAEAYTIKESFLIDDPQTMPVSSI